MSISEYITATCCRMYIICYRQGDGVVHRALVDRQLTRPRAPEVVWGGGALLERDEGAVAEHRVRAVLEGLARQLDLGGNQRFAVLNHRVDPHAIDATSAMVYPTRRLISTPSRR